MNLNLLKFGTLFLLNILLDSPTILERRKR